MKSCRRNRKSIALLAVGELDVRQSQELHAHLETCEGCRRYLEEISNVTGTLAAVEMESNIQTSEIFHQKVVARIKAVRSTSFVRTGMMQLWTTRLNWRVLLPLSGAVAAIVLLFFDTRHPEVQLPAPSNIQVVTPVAVTETDFLPSIVNYKMAASRSMDSLNEMLDREADRIPSPMPVYTASGSSISALASN
jgi:anti-sigma factor RsiW